MGDIVNCLISNTLWAKAGESVILSSIRVACFDLAGFTCLAFLWQCPRSLGVVRFQRMKRRYLQVSYNGCGLGEFVFWNAFKNNVLTSIWTSSKYFLDLGSVASITPASNLTNQQLR